MRNLNVEVDTVKCEVFCTCDWFAAGSASLGEELSEAFSTVRLLVTGGEALSRQRSAAVGASEALSVPWLVLVSHSTTCDNLQNSKHVSESCQVDKRPH